MPRPMTKPALIEAAEGQFAKMWQLIDKIPEEEKNAKFAFEDRDKNLRDILIHLYEWHQLLLKWVEANQNGEQKPFLPPPYNWKTYPQMNILFWEKHQKTSYKEAKEGLEESHAGVMKRITSFSDGELFTKRYFTWTGTSSLGSYCISATSSHYDWACKKISKHLNGFSKTRKREN